MGFRRLWALRALALSLALAFSAQAYAYVVYVDCDSLDVTADPVQVAQPVAAAARHHVVGHHRHLPHRALKRHVICKFRISHKCRKLGWMDPGAVPYGDADPADGFLTAYWDGGGVATLDPPAVPEPTEWVLLILGFGALAVRSRSRITRLRFAGRILAKAKWNS